MKTLKEGKKGITLIALVITIIVLLILAGVSISMLTGQNGILTQAQTAKEETEKASIIEQAKTDILGIQSGGDISLTQGQLKDILSKYFAPVPDDVDTYDVLTTIDGKYEIAVSDIYDGELITPPITAANFPVSDYGAIVNGYNCTNNAGVNAWKIFYSDKNNIYIIADDYIHKDYCPNSANNTIYDKGNGYKLSMDSVVNDYQGSQDITDERIKALNNDYFNVKVYSSAKSNMKATAYMLDIDVWSVFAGDKAEYAIGGPTIEMFFYSYNEKYGTNYVAKATSNLGYQFGSDNANLDNLELNKKDDSLYVINSDDKASFMWLSSPSASHRSNMICVDVAGNVCLSSFSNAFDGFRPLVCLKSDVELQRNDDGSYSIK